MTEAAGDGDGAVRAAAPLVVLALGWLALELAGRQRRDLGPFWAGVAVGWAVALVVAALLLSLREAPWWPS